MEVPGADSDWRSPQFRQNVAAQIEDAMRKGGSGNTTHKTGTDMENHSFIKAKTREEYLFLVSLLITHFRDINKKKLGGAGDCSSAPCWVPDGVRLHRVRGACRSRL